MEEEKKAEESKDFPPRGPSRTIFSTASDSVVFHYPKGPKIETFLKSGFLKRALAQTCFRVWYQVRFLRRIFGHFWGLVYGEGGAPGTVPLHNLRVTSHVLHQEVPLGWYRKKRLF